MPTATGFIRTAGSGTKFSASFTIDDLLYSFAGSFTPSVPDFVSNSAMLEYNSVGELTATRTFNGRIGTNTITLSVAPGNPGRVKITGDLDMPITPASTASGNGSWTQN